MGRKYVECKDFPGETNCSKIMTADNEVDLMEAVVKHAINVHGMCNTTDFRNRVSMAFKDGNPPR